MRYTEILKEADDKEKDDLTLWSLDYDLDDLEPVMNEDNVDYHYNTHTKGYFKKAKENKSDSFNVNGAKLHNVWWDQFNDPDKTTSPKRETKEFINKYFSSMDDFKKKMNESCLGIQGSGWVALLNTGKLKSIPEHQHTVNGSKNGNIILIIDMWEHAFYPTYGPDKNAYLKNIWKIIDWDKINERIKDL